MPPHKIYLNETLWTKLNLFMRFFIAKAPTVQLIFIAIQSLLQIRIGASRTPGFLFDFAIIHRNSHSLWIYLVGQNCVSVDRISKPFQQPKIIVS